MFETKDKEGTETVKSMKDPIYGYISIPSKYVAGIIDTPAFQRLRRIIQTSYSPLYSSALHNRFVHSIGVYYLGKIVITKLEKEIKINYLGNKEDLRELDTYCSVFQLACLLHDVGHAPFSHTGEKYYKTNESVKELHKILSECVGDASFQEDISVAKAAAPHEIMSAIIGIKEFSKFIDTVEKRVFLPDV